MTLDIGINWKIFKEWFECRRIYGVFSSHAKQKTELESGRYEYFLHIAISLRTMISRFILYYVIRHKLSDEWAFSKIHLMSQTSRHATVSTRIKFPPPPVKIRAFRITPTFIIYSAILSVASKLSIHSYCCLNLMLTSQNRSFCNTISYWSACSFCAEITANI